MYPLSDNEEAIKMLRGIAAKTKLKRPKDLAREKEMMTACSVAHQLFDEAMSEIKEGEGKWSEIVDDLAKNLKAIPVSAVETEDDEDGD